MQPRPPTDIAERHRGAALDLMSGTATARNRTTSDAKETRHPTEEPRNPKHPNLLEVTRP
jgi:hypothetical protein